MLHVKITSIMASNVMDNIYHSSKPIVLNYVDFVKSSLIQRRI